MYSTTACCEDRLRSFTLTADSDPSRPDPYTYTDPGGPAQDMYTVVPDTRISFPVEEVRIRARDNNFKNVSILTLCEVVVFGGEYKATYWLCIKFKLLHIQQYMYITILVIYSYAIACFIVQIHKLLCALLLSKK